MINPSGNLTKYASNSSSLPTIKSGVELKTNSKLSQIKDKLDPNKIMDNIKTGNTSGKNDATNDSPSVYYKTTVHGKDNDIVASTLV